MELDDLRRQWQQPEAAPPAPLTASQLNALVAQPPKDGLVEKLRRNTRLEAGAGLVATVLMLLLLVVDSGKPLSLFYAVLLSGLAVGMSYYYYRVLLVLRLLAQTTGSVRGHLARLYDNLRRLLRLYYRVSLATGPIILLAIYGFLVGRELVRGEAFRGSFLLWTGIGLVVFGAVLQIGVVHATRWWVQSFYGQYLDQLENQLRELTDEPQPDTPS